MRTKSILRNLWEEPVEFQEEALRTYYKVTFVRNPLVRLVSGYRNKMIRAPDPPYSGMIKVNKNFIISLILCVLTINIPDSN